MARMRRHRSSIPSIHIALTLFFLWMGPANAPAGLEVNVTRVGFPTLQGDAVRHGRWAPVMVDLALLNQPEVHGVARISQPDIDGDRAFDEVPFHLRVETGGTQRLFLYVLPVASSAESPLYLELFDENGEALEVLSDGAMTYQARPGQQPSSLPDDDLLVLSVSTGTIGPLEGLGDFTRQQSLSRQIHVGHMSPIDLPELWIGLEAVDVIVWDDADPNDLSARQVEALLHWVADGGVLIMGASRTAPSLALTASLATVLPVEMGELTSVADLPTIRRQWMTSFEGASHVESGPPWWEAPYDPPIPAVRCKLKPDAQSLVDPKRFPNRKPEEADLMSRRRVGRGEIVFAGVTLRDLFKGGGEIREFFLHLVPIPKLTQSERVMTSQQSLFAPVVSAVSFATSGGLYLAFVFLFSVVYFLAATIGSWSLLGARGWRHHSWSGFAAVGVIASVFSILIVNSIRGLADSLHQLTIIDLDVGGPRGWGTAYFGLRSGLDRRVDVWLPSDAIAAEAPDQSPCFLRPLPSSGFDDAVAGFADPEVYRLIPGNGVVQDTRLRGTLKRFEGRWTGTLSGRLHGEVRIKRDGLRVEPESYLVNDLGVGLRDCHLIHTTSAAEPGRTFRGADIFVFPIGEMKNGERLDLAERCYQPSPGESLSQYFGRHSLTNAQKGWAGGLRSRLRDIGQGGAPAPMPLGPEEAALLLLSTLGEYDPAQDQGVTSFLAGTWSRDRARQLDLSGELRPEIVWLVGFADHPGPARLFRRAGDRPFVMVEPEEGHARTLYRMRIPARILEVSQPRPPESTETAP